MDFQICVYCTQIQNQITSDSWFIYNNNNLFDKYIMLTVNYQKINCKKKNNFLCDKQFECML